MFKRKLELLFLPLSVLLLFQFLCSVLNSIFATPLIICISGKHAKSTAYYRECQRAWVISEQKVHNIYTIQILSGFSVA